MTAPSEPARFPSSERAPSGARWPLPRSQPDTRQGHSTGLPAMMLWLIVAAWVLAVVAQVGGWSEMLRHDRLIEEGAGPLPTLGLFLVGWLMMVAAMMLPSSFSTSQRFETVACLHPRPMPLRLAFLAGYLVQLTVFGMAALVGDTALHGLVGAWSWLGDRPWLVGGIALMLAGGFELACLSTRWQTILRIPGIMGDRKLDWVRSTRLGADHGLRQLRRCWPVMLVSFAVGMTNLVWMAALTLVMMLDGSELRWTRAARAGVGGALIGIGVVTLAHPAGMSPFVPIGA